MPEIRQALDHSALIELAQINPIYFLRMIADSATRVRGLINAVYTNPDLETQRQTLHGWTQSGAEKFEHPGQQGITDSNILLIIKIREALRAVCPHIRPEHAIKETGDTKTAILDIQKAVINIIREIGDGDYAYTTYRDEGHQGHKTYMLGEETLKQDTSDLLFSPELQRELAEGREYDLISVKLASNKHLTA